MKGSNLTAVELFCGIGGFRLATDSLNIKTIWANDIDDDACKVYTDRFGSRELRQGDINELISEVPPHDILTAGFPCQPFSSAGKKKGIQDPRGTLFESIVKIISIRKPKYFVLENVKRLLEMESGKHFATILSALSSHDYLIEWRIMNAVDFGLPQNRSRIIIIGKRREKEERPGEVARLASTEEVNGSNSSLFSFDSWKEITNHGKKFPNWGIAYKGRFFGKQIEGFSEAKEHVKLRDYIQEDVDESFFFNGDSEKRMKNSVFINRFVRGVQVLYNQRGGARMGYTIFGTEGIAPTLTSSTSRHYERYLINGAHRRLTNVEYARIQGFPDLHCSAVTTYNQYKLYGNAVPPPMVKWALMKLLHSKGVRINII